MGVDPEEFKNLTKRKEIRDREKRIIDARAGRVFKNRKTFEAVAEEMGVTASAVNNWIQGRVPAERVLPLCMVTGEKPEKFRPDLYPECCNSVIDDYLRRYKENA